ncbi:MAG: hypothetical protein Q8P59_08565 [Dehalococcoidia bacterium]|nr:hypothetical protein [Dehalococcoidia bacterium]
MQWYQNSPDSMGNGLEVVAALQSVDQATLSQLMPEARQLLTRPRGQCYNQNSILIEALSYALL